MSIPQEINTWANAVVNFWKVKNLDISNGASADIIENAEQHVSFIFPETFKNFIKKLMTGMIWAGMNTCLACGH